LGGPDSRRSKEGKVSQGFAYVTAFGEGLLEVGLAHAEIAIKNHTREMIIRRVCFKTEAKDRIGFYIGRLKELTNEMRLQLLAGKEAAYVALSKRDFQSRSEAFQTNELQPFITAWTLFSKEYLVKVRIEKTNGQTYLKWLPAPSD
jgi:hypothetical protein